VLTIHHEGDREKEVYTRAEGKHLIEEVRECFLLIEANPCLLSCKSSLIGFAKRWQTYMSGFQHPNGGTLPSFSRRYKLITIPTTNHLGRWFTLRFDDQGWVTAEEYAAARLIHEAATRGSQRVGPAPTDDVD
jgi:hypothetical protein